MSRARRTTDVDKRFDDPPELTERLVSHIEGQVTDQGLLPQAVRNLETKVGELVGGVTEMRGDMKALLQQLAPVIADYGIRLTAIERRQDHFDERLTALEKPRRKARKR